MSVKITNCRRGRRECPQQTAAPSATSAQEREIADRNDLAEILTMVIWTAGPQHAAVNFTQLEHLSYLPANPLAGFTDEPRGRDHTLDDWLANLPPLDVAVQRLSDELPRLGAQHDAG